MSDLSRYARQIVLPEVGVNGQRILRDSTVLIVGVGGLGSPAAMYLAGAGVGRLLLMDQDRVELTNLQRQIVYRAADVGRDKALAAKDRLAEINSDVRVEARGAATAEALADAVAEADVVLDCTDNFPTRFAVNRACVAVRRPLVSGAAVRLEGQLAVFDARRSDSPCYACLYPAAGDAAETCEEGGVLGPVVGVIGSLQALEAIKLLLGADAGVGLLRRWNARQLDWKTVKIPRDPGCNACGATDA